MRLFIPYKIRLKDISFQVTSIGKVNGIRQAENKIFLAQSDFLSDGETTINYCEKAVGDVVTEDFKERARKAIKEKYGKAGN